MEVKVAQEAGFCFGVQRALDMIERALAEGKELTTLGPLIHNWHVVRRLAERGAPYVDVDSDGDDIGGLRRVRAPWVVIRSHGVRPEVYEEAKKLNLQLIDATCPFVRTAQEVARQLAQEGYQVVVVGKEGHPEVRGLVGHAGGKAIVVDSPEKLEGLRFKRKVGVLAQTTMRPEVFEAVVARLVHMAREVRAFNTVCYTTRRRQEEARRIASEVDAMVVIGSRRSSNTKRLVEVAKGVGTPTYHIESVEELKPEWFKGAKRIGVTAGASTPPELVREVVEWLRKLDC